MICVFVKIDSLLLSPPSLSPDPSLLTVRAVEFVFVVCLKVLLLLAPAANASAKSSKNGARNEEEIGEEGEFRESSLLSAPIFNWFIVE